MGGRLLPARGATPRREVSLRIHCDHCDAQIDSDAALCEELECGEIYWFCSEECRATALLVEEEDEPHAEPAQAPV